MAETPLHLAGPDVDAARWGADVDPDDDFDADELEAAIRRSRAQTYAALAALDAA